MRFAFAVLCVCLSAAAQPIPIGYYGPAEGTLWQGAQLAVEEANRESDSFLLVQGWDDNVANVCIESTYAFYETVIDELVGLFQEAGAPLEVVHLGGDEVPNGVWEDSPACKKLIASSDDLFDVRDLSPYFYGRIVQMLEMRGLKGAGWEEIGLGRRVGDSRRRAAARWHPQCRRTRARFGARR